MKKRLLLFALSVFVSFFAGGINNSSTKSIGDKDIPFVERIKQSTLVVVLLEENEKYYTKLTKKGRNYIANTYSNSIKTYNDNIRTMVPQCLKIASNVIFKTPTEIKAMTVDERCKYSFLLYDRAPYYSPSGTATFGCNFFFKHQLDVEQEISDYDDAIQFECLDTSYAGQCECRKLHLYAPLGAEKEVSSGELQQNLLEIVPTQADLKICLMLLQKQVDFCVKNENSTKEEQKEMIAAMQQDAPGYYDTIKNKTLLICKQDLDKSLNADRIAAYYPFNYRVVSKDEFDKTILYNDGRYCLLLVNPVEKVSGAYGGTAYVKYTHLIINPGSGNIIFREGSEHQVQGTIGMGGLGPFLKKCMKELTKKLTGN